MDVNRDSNAALHNPNLYVVTGGPGSGKTTLLLELQRRGFRFAPEVAREIIQQQVKEGGNAVPWGDRESYTELMLRRSIDSYLAHTPASSPCFADRGIPDTWGYAKLIGLKARAHIWNVCEKYRYAPLVFAAPFWEEIYETDEERKQTLQEAELTAQITVDTYEECGYKVIVLPKTTPQKRADFVLSQIHLRAESS